MCKCGHKHDTGTDIRTLFKQRDALQILLDTDYYMVSTIHINSQLELINKRIAVASGI